MTAELPAKADPHRFDELARSPAHLYILITTEIALVLLVMSIWRRRSAVELLVAIEGVRFSVNLLMIFVMVRLARRPRVHRSVLIGEVIFNVIVNIASVHIAGWDAPAALLYVPLQMVLLDVYLPSERATLWAALTLIAFVVAAQVDHAGLRVVCSIAGMSAGMFAIVRSRSRLLIGVLRDFAEGKARLERMQATLLLQEKLSSIGVLAAGIAHEINNPMGYVTANVRLLLEELRTLSPLPPSLQEYVDEILPDTLDGAARVNSIVGDLRRFARGDPDGFVTYDLAEEVASAIRLSEPIVAERALVSVDVDPDLPPMLGRPRQIGQVLVNLLVNAAQAMPDRRGRIDVSVRRRDGGVTIRLRDDGSGMSPEIVAKLFQPFFTTKPVGQGTGLGLSVAWGILRDHGGHIDVESGPGAGTCFTIALPSVPPPIQAAAAA